MTPRAEFIIVSATNANLTRVQQTMNANLPVIAGSIATFLFALSTLPMVAKAYGTKNLQSYSLGYLLLGNAGNLFYSVYVYHLPLGPIWILHTFYLIVTGLMLYWYLRYEWWPRML